MSKHNRVRKIHRRDQGISEELQQAALHPVLKRIYANRQINTLAQLDMEWILDDESQFSGRK